LRRAAARRGRAGRAVERSARGCGRHAAARARIAVVAGDDAMTGRRRLPLVVVAVSVGLLAIAFAAALATPGRLVDDDAPGWQSAVAFVLTVMSFVLVGGLCALPPA